MDNSALLLCIGVFMISLGWMSIPPFAHSHSHNPTPNDVDPDAPNVDRPQPTCDEHSMSMNTCQNFARHTRNHLNHQIRVELNASYHYLAMALYFQRDDVAYPGFSKFFHAMADEEHEHARMFMDYLIKRGGTVTLKEIGSPINHNSSSGTDWGTPAEAIYSALQMERQVNTAILDMHWDAQGKNDGHLLDFLDTHFLTEQVDSIRKLAMWYTMLSRYNGDSLAVHLFDQELLDGKRS